jgi:hypothetical protein
VSDPNFLWLIRKFLKAGLVEDGQWKASLVGTPQGGIASPILANIFLHYVLDLWFEKVFKPDAKGYVELIRYCDDFVVACASEQDARRFLEELEQRFSKFGLKISKEKTRIAKFGREQWERSKATGAKVATFDFLGFTHYCTASRQGKFIMGHKTMKKKLAGGLREIKEWLKRTRSTCRIKQWWPILRAKLTGHYVYFGISGNMRCLRQFYRSVFWMVLKWINRRSQKRSMTLRQYRQYLEWNPLPLPRLYHSLYTLSPSKGTRC